MTKISFLVPTLNRGRYVVRAVQSCLDAAARAGVAAEVVVLDSMSDDGSWGLLTDAFATDPCVILAQNARGLGPTHSWLDAAAHVTGDYVTYVWSDDYVSPRFVELLLPMLAGGRHIAIGDGIVRHIDDEAPFPEGAGTTRSVPAEAIAAGFYGVGPGRDLAVPVSPACSLFSRAAFDEWRETVPRYCRAAPLREALTWRRAIGPDLMLYLTASSMPQAPVQVTTRPVVQFSTHDQSITIGSSRWNLVTGYWLARVWHATHKLPAADLAVGDKSECYARLLLQGLVGAAFAPREGVLPAAGAARREMLAETRELRRIASAQGVGVAGIARAAIGEARQQLARRRASAPASA